LEPIKIICYRQIIKTHPIKFNTIMFEEFFIHLRNLQSELLISLKWFYSMPSKIRGVTILSSVVPAKVAPNFIITHYPNKDVLDRFCFNKSLDIKSHILSASYHINCHSHIVQLSTISKIPQIDFRIFGQIDYINWLFRDELI